MPSKDSKGKVKKILKSKLFHGLLGVAISLGLIIWMYFIIDWSSVGNQISNANYWVLFPATLLLAFHYFIRAYRWRFLLPEGHKVSIKTSFDALGVGNLATNVLPLRAGEFIRPGFLCLQSNYAFSTCFVSVVIERFFDLSVVLLCFGVMVFYIPDIPGWAHHGAFLLTGVAFGILLFMICGALIPEKLLSISDFFVRFFPAFLREKIRIFLKDFLLGATVLRGKWVLLVVSALSFAVWFTGFIFLYAFFFLFHLDASFWVACSVTIIIALAVAAPSAPGFIGVYQTACIAAFALFGVNKEIAVAYAIITHAFQYIIFVVYGMVVLVQSDLRLRDIRRASS